MMTFTEAVQAGLDLCRKHEVLNDPNGPCPGHVTFGFACRIACKVLRDDGLEDPPRDILGPLAEAIWQATP